MSRQIIHTVTVKTASNVSITLKRVVDRSIGSHPLWELWHDGTLADFDVCVLDLIQSHFSKPEDFEDKIKCANAVKAVLNY
jgi:hypothetical protein